MAELWKAGKAKGRLSPPPPAPWKSRPHREIPTFPQRRRNGLEKWKTKNRFSTFPSRFATTTSVFYLRNAAAFGRPGRRFAAHRTPSRSPNSKSTPNRKELFPGLQRLRFSGSSCIGNESRFQDHSSIGICCRRVGAECNIKVNGIAIPQGNKRFRAYRLLSTEPRALASGLLQAAWRPLANARGSVPSAGGPLG